MDLAVRTPLLADVLGRAGAAPMTLARDRYLPVAPVLGALLPEPGLVRGRVTACEGDAAVSLALALAAAASAAGSWTAFVGVPALGIEAAGELGVALERVVAVDADPRRPQEWAERMAAAADGVELVVTAAPAGPERWWRLVRQRVQARGVVVLVVPSPEAIAARGTVPGADLRIEARTTGWEGVGEGYGRLCRRRVELAVHGRRSPLPVVGECWLPGRSGAVEPIVGPELDDTAAVPAPPGRAAERLRLVDEVAAVLGAAGGG